jgi:hypothetical protein
LTNLTKKSLRLRRIFVKVRVTTRVTDLGHCCGTNLNSPKEEKLKFRAEIETNFNKG